MKSQSAPVPGKGPLVFVTAVAVALVILAITVLPHFISSGAKGSVGPQLATAGVRSFPVTEMASGTAVPASELEVNFVNSGQLVEIDAKVGLVVTAGMVLAKIDPSVAQSDVLQATADVAEAKSSTLISRDFSDAQAAIAAAQAQLQRAQDELADTTLVAPSAGTVLEVNGQVGEIASGAATAQPTLPGTSAPIPAVAGTGISAGGGTASPTNLPFIVIGDPSNLVVGAAFSSNAAADLSAGQTGSITADTVSGLAVPCHLLAVAADPTLIDGAYMFWASIVPNKPSGQLRSGMAVDVTIAVGQANNVIAVPQSAVYTLGGVPHVDVWHGNHAVSTVVGTGLQGTELVQITSGLSAGEQVVLAAFQGVP